MGFIEYITGEEFNDFIFNQDFDRILVYYLCILSLIIFTRQMSRKMGYSTLMNFISGKYHRPREETRVFMFLDLTASTKLAVKLGDMRYHSLLNDLYYDITKCILTTRGEIYRYVGDEIVVSWKLETGIRDANCIRTYYYILYEMRRLKEKYINKYGFVPQFTTSFHCGKVITGEIGEVKTQIVFHGEALYTNSQVEKKCGELNKPMLITHDLLHLITVPPVYNVEECGRLDLGLEGRSMRLYTLTEIKDQATSL
jgi:adenylate cyclase